MIVPFQLSSAFEFCLEGIKLTCASRVFLFTSSAYIYCIVLYETLMESNMFNIIRVFFFSLSSFNHVNSGYRHEEDSWEVSGSFGL